MSIRTRAKGKRPKRPGSSTVQLVNPVSDHFKAFIIGNALSWQVRAMVEIEPTMEPDAYASLMAEFQGYRPGMAYGSSKVIHDALEGFGKRYVVQEDEAKGQTLVLCGAGPSLRDHAAEYCAGADQVWGCNSAMTWLHDNGHRVTHGFTVDQTPHMVEEWQSTPNVEYLIASTVHPDLTELLRDGGRRYRMFHNFVGIQEQPVPLVDAGHLSYMPYEDWLYATLFPFTMRSGSGLNAVTRALDVAHFMGFEKIHVLGADCSLRFASPVPDSGFGSPEYMEWLRTQTVMHADGGNAIASDATPITLHGEIDGRVWLTKPDMAISAQWLVKMARRSEGRIELVGDTLPNALMAKDEAFMQRLPNFVDADGNLANLPV